MTVNKKNQSRILTSNDKYIIILRNKRITSISNWKKTIIDPYVKKVIKDGSKEGDLVKLAVLFKTIGKQKSMMTVDKTFNYIRAMPRELCYYWYTQIITHQNVQLLRNKISENALMRYIE